jgi:carbon-monoxide dehydrogenase medium subunit
MSGRDVAHTRRRATAIEEAAVKPPPFRYSVPSTIAEAIGLLAENADADVRVLAGGQSLVPLMNFRLAQPGHLVDLRKVGELVGIRSDGDTLVIGAMTRQADVEDSPEVAVGAPLLAEAIAFVAHRPIRNSGTVGGSLAHADPSAELPVVALALDAQLVAAGPGGARTVPAADFFRGPFSTALAPDEILTEIRLPLRRSGEQQAARGGHAFVEFARTHGSFAVVSVATDLDVVDDRVTRAAIAISGVAPTPIRAFAAEQVLTGAQHGRAAAVDVADAAVENLTPSNDVHAGAATRIDLARTHVRRAIETALTRAQDRR